MKRVIWVHIIQCKRLRYQNKSVRAPYGRDYQNLANGSSAVRYLFLRVSLCRTTLLFPENLEAILSIIDEYLKVRDDVCNQFWNVASRTLTLL